LCYVLTNRYQRNNSIKGQQNLTFSLMCFTQWRLGLLGLSPSLRLRCIL